MPIYNDGKLAGAAGITSTEHSALNHTGITGAGAVDETMIDNATNLPAVAGAGRVTVGAAQATNRLVRGLRVRRRTVRGYMPNQGADVNNVNGVAGSNLFAIGSGLLLSVSGLINRSNGQSQLFEGLPNNGGHLRPVYCSGGIGGANKYVRLWNSFASTEYNGQAFMIAVEYTDSANP